MEHKIKFGAIELISKAISPPPRVQPEQNEFGFDFSVAIKLGPERKLAVVVTDVSIVILQTKTQMAKFQTVMFFEFPEFDNTFTKVNDLQYNIPIEVEILLKSVALSTTRGIIYSEVRGTYLHGAVLPIIDMQGIITRDREKADLEKQTSKKAK